jgi:hypothetical protein
VIAQPRRRVIVALILLALGIAALRDFSRLGAALPWRTMDEFADFYCAGWALDRGASPYTYEPLRTCEHRFNTGPGFRASVFASNPAVAIPAPLPPYDFPAFMALARSNFAAARIVDAIAIVSAVVLCAIALAELGVPLALAAAALTLAAGYVELNAAQIVPFALLALILCGLALARGRDWLAGLLAAVTAIEPSIGIPVITATLLFVPRARWAVVITAALLAVVAIALVGTGGVIEYIARVLPAQAGSEVRFPFQYSLSFALAFFGVPAAAATDAGAFSFIALFALGLWLAARAPRAFRSRSLLVFLPALCAATAGTYVHQEELCFALPAALILASRSQGTPRVVAGAAVCALSIPWIFVWGMKQLFLASTFVSAIILERLRVDFRMAVIVLGALALTIYCFELHPPHLMTPEFANHVYAANDLVQREWRDYAAQRSTHDGLWFAIKIPTWAAQLALLVIAAGRIRNET